MLTSCLKLLRGASGTIVADKLNLARSRRERSVRNPVIIDLNTLDAGRNSVIYELAKNLNSMAPYFNINHSIETIRSNMTRLWLQNAEQEILS